MNLSRYLWSIAGNLGMLALVTIAPAKGQPIAADGTIPTSVTTPDNLNFTINGGSQAGNNLFHSFSSFSLPTGGSAYFNNVDIANIINRVTGSSVSNIDGLLRTNGAANLFLINPNGIVFGPNAALNVGGSFIASTANAVRLGDRTFFSATPGTALLLTVNVPMGLQYNGTATPISVISSNLAVSPGRTLALVGGNVTVSGGNLIAPGGRIELGSVSGSSLVSLNSIDRKLSLGYEGVQNFHDIRLNQAANVDTSGIGGGEMGLQGRSISLIEGSRLVSLTLGANPGGTITINASESVEFVGTQTYTRSLLGFIFGPVTATDLRNGLYTFSFGTGKAGDAVINTPRLIARDGVFIATSTLGEGRAGNLTVNATEIELTASALVSGTSGAGDAGILTIDTRTLTARDNAVLGTSNLGGTGRVGDLIVNATDSIELIGTNVIPLPGTNGIFTGFFSTNPTGNGGNIEVTTGRLVLRDGAGISAGSFAGIGGNITVTATEAVELIGRTPNGRQRTSLSSDIGMMADRGGNLTVRTNRLSVRDGAIISVQSVATGDAGNIDIFANSVRLSDGGTIAATSNLSGEGGNILLSTRSLELRDRSIISAEAGTARGTGNGGNLAIDTDTFVALGNSDISANAFEGMGGNIQITTRGIFRSRDSEITASSQLGINGLVRIDRPEIDPSTGLVVLSSDVVDVESLVASGCATDGELASQFVITGRGGLPPSPEGTLGNELVMADLRTVPLQSTGNLSPTIATVRLDTSANAIVEASGWAIDSEGRVVLTAINPKVVPKSFGLVQNRCRNH